MKIFDRAAVTIFSTLFLLTGFVIYASASDDSIRMTDSKLNSVIALVIGKSNAVVDGKDKKIDATNDKVVPFVEGGRTFVPVRFISENLGADVSASGNSVEIKTEDVHIKLVIGQKNMTVNDKTVKMDASAVVKNGRTFVPVKFIAEALGKNIFYDSGLIIISPSDIKIDATADKTLIDTLRERISNSQEKSQGNKPGNKSGNKPENFEPADLTGEVESITTDNKITIKLVEMPQLGEMKKPQENTENESGQNTQDTQTPQEPPQGQQGQTNQGTSPQRTITYTGETKTITVTSEIPITTMNRTEQGMETVSLKFEDIKAGDMISVWYSDEENKTISKISVQAKR